MQRDEFNKKLDDSIAGFSEKVSACYLNKIYVRENKSDVYELALVDSKFTSIQLMRTCDLYDICKFDINKDFGLDDNYLQCNQYVNAVPGESLDDIDSVKGGTCADTIFDLIVTGADNNYVLLDDEVVESPEGSLDSYGVTSFKNIKFAKTTMSIYAPMINGNGLYNKMLVVEENGRLVVRPFYFGIQSAESCNFGNFVTRKEINGVNYDIYNVKFISIFSNAARFLSAPIINSAIQMRERCDFCISALSDLMRDLYVLDGTNPEWVGGNSSYTSNYQIEFSSTLQKLSKRSRDSILDDLLKGEEPIYSNDERVRLLRVAVKMLSINDGIPSFDSLNATINALKHNSIWYSSYIMSVRYYLYCSHTKIIDADLQSRCANVLHGGLSNEGTIVKEGF